ncbi:MAG: phosphoribosyltransferase [Thermoplasmata archaeon]
MAELPRCRLATWADVDGWADRLAAQIREKAKVPGTIVGLTRGGWVPARLVADRLGVKRMISLRAQHWGVTAVPTGAAEVTEGLSGPVNGHTVLVVDDITDTGESLSLAMAHVRAEGPDRVESATLLHIAHSKYVPTYFGEAIPADAWVWVVFPWNYWEDIAALAQRAAERGGPGIDRVRASLHEWCGLDVPREDLERVAKWVAIE